MADPSFQGSHLPLSPGVRPSGREKDAPEVFIGSFRGTKRRRCPPPCQASIRGWSSPLLRAAGRGHGQPCASSRGIKPPCGRSGGTARSLGHRRHACAFSVNMEDGSSIPSISPFFFILCIGISRVFRWLLFHLRGWNSLNSG